MKSGKIILIGILFAISLQGCKKSYVASDKQLILFQYDYINFAWGYTHEGFYIDDKGNIYEYQNPEGWNFHKGDYNLTDVQMAENLAKCTLSDKKVDIAELSRFSSHIRNLAASKVTAMKNEAADAGTITYLCYSYNEQSSVYKGTLIKMEGDFSCENLNFFSRKISLWLKGINTGLIK